MENTNNSINPFNGETVAEQTHALMVMDDGTSMIADLTSRQTAFCSLEADSPKAKALLFKAMNNPDKRIGDCINMDIKVKDIFCEVVTCTNQQTGERQLCPRIVLIDDKGIGYQAVSLGIYGAVKKMIQVFGLPSWDEPLTVTVKQITKGERKMLTLDVKI